MKYPRIARCISKWQLYVNEEIALQTFHDKIEEYAILRDADFDFNAQVALYEEISQKREYISSYIRKRHEFNREYTLS